MPARTSHHQLAGKVGALKSWSNTVDRSARTSSARNNSPASIDWHLRRLPAKFDDATERQRLDAADAARRAYYAELAMKSAAARRGGGDAR